MRSELGWPNGTPVDDTPGRLKPYSRAVNRRFQIDSVSQHSMRKILCSMESANAVWQA